MLDALPISVDGDLSALRQLVRQRIESGALPSDLATDRYWAGRGGGGLCSACEQAIQPHDNEYEIVLDESSPTAGSLLFHRPCLYIWIAECRRSAE